MEIIKLMSTGNKIQAELIVQMLKQNGINCYYKENGAGSYMDITCGFSVFGQEIFINEEDKEKAEELIDIFNEEEQENTGNTYDKKIRKPVLIFLIMIIIMFLISIAIVILS